MIIMITTKTHENLERPSLIKKGFCIFMVMLQTFLFMPIFDVITRMIFASYNSSELSSTPDIDHTTGMSEFLSDAILGFITILLLLIVMLYIVRVFNICVPSENVPWCSPVSKILYLNLAIKIMLVLCVTIDHEGKQALIEVLILFFMQSFQACYRLLFAPSYLKEVDLFIKTKDFTVSLIFFIGIVCKILIDKQNYDVLYFLLFIPIVTVGWI